jgi:hypothetical protein
MGYFLFSTPLRDLMLIINARFVRRSMAAAYTRQQVLSQSVLKIAYLLATHRYRRAVPK